MLDGFATSALTIRSREPWFPAQSYRRKTCSECGRKMIGVQRIGADPAYCGDRCARLAQPHVVITGGGCPDG